MTYECMDNFALDVRARSEESFKHAMAIAFAHAPGGNVSHWCEHPDFGLVLFWSAREEDKFHTRKIVPFPHELDAKAATTFVWDWLMKAKRERFKLEGFDCHYDDGDVQCEEAWRVYVEDWGHVGQSHSAAVAILPVWAWLGK